MIHYILQRKVTNKIQGMHTREDKCSDTDGNTSNLYIHKGVILYLWWLKWVIWWEVYVYQEQTPSIKAILWANYCCLPMKHVSSNRACKHVKLECYEILFK